MLTKFIQNYDESLIIVRAENKKNYINPIISRSINLPIWKATCQNYSLLENHRKCD